MKREINEVNLVTPSPAGRRPPRVHIVSDEDDDNSPVVIRYAPQRIRRRLTSPGAYVDDETPQPSVITIDHDSPRARSFFSEDELSGAEAEAAQAMGACGSAEMYNIGRRNDSVESRPAETPEDHAEYE